MGINFGKIGQASMPIVCFTWGAIGRRVVSIYAQEVSLFGQGLQKSEKLVCFLTLMLNKVKDIKKTAGIRRLLNKRTKRR